MFERFVIGAMVSAVFLTTPKLWNYGKQKKAESIENGKVYYGLLYYRAFLLFLAGLMCAEIALLPFVGYMEGDFALLLLFAGAVPYTILFVHLYKKRFIKKYLSESLDVETGAVSGRLNQSETQENETQKNAEAEHLAYQHNATKPGRSRRYEELEEHYQKRLESEKALRWCVTCLLLVIAIIVGVVAYCLGRTAGL